MIIFLYGKDGYRLNQSLEDIIEEYKKKYPSGMSFLVLDASDGSFNNVLEGLESIVKTVSFFNEKRLVIIKNPFSISEGLHLLIEKWGLIEDKETILVCVEYQGKTELNKKSKELYALLTVKTSVVKNFESLDEKKMESWVSKEVVDYGKKIDHVAVGHLLSCVGDDSWLLSQEINKLANYKEAVGGDDITVADIDMLTVPKENPNIFVIVDAVANRNHLYATKLIYDYFELNADPYYVFSMIIYQFRNLLRVKDLAKNAVPYATIIKKTGLNPFVVKKTYEQCKKYDLEELKNLFTKLADLDVSVKNGETDLSEGLYKFVFSV